MEPQNVPNVGQQVSDVIDKLSDKMGIAADKLQPIAEQLVRETSKDGYATIFPIIGVGSLLLLFLLVSASVINMNTDKYEKESDRLGARTATAIITSVASFCTILITSITVISRIHQAVAPSVYLVETLLK